MTPAAIRPHIQRFARHRKHRARRQARLVTTVGIFEQEAITLGPHAGALARAPCHPIAPASVGSAVIIRRETLSGA
jgi:hypothetical protein